MQVKLITKRNSNIVLGYTTSPIEENDKVYDLNIEDIFIGYSYIDQNGEFQSNKEAYDIAIFNQNKELKEQELRENRQYLLEKGFDPWEKAMLVGREANDDSIYQWYNALLDLDEIAFLDGNIPERIKYYLGGKNKWNAF